MSVSFYAPWPDPNSPVLSKVNFGVPLVELFKWLDVRDALLQQNYKKHDIKKALAIARNCKHPDALWLTSVFEGKDVSTKEDAQEVLLRCENDARALCFAWCLRYSDDSSLLDRASDRGCAFACSTLCWHLWDENKEEAFRFAKLAAGLLERDGFFWLGRCYRDGVACEKDSTSAKENFLLAAELGHLKAAGALRSMLDSSAPPAWIWMSRISLRGFPNSFLISFKTQVKRFISGAGNATVVFLIGHALNGKIDVEKKCMFGQQMINFENSVERAKQAVCFYQQQVKSARLAVNTWTMVGIRLGVVKDMRIFIGRMIWERRFEANYKI